MTRFGVINFLSTEDISIQQNYDNNEFISFLNAQVHISGVMMGGVNLLTGACVEFVGDISVEV